MPKATPGVPYVVVSGDNLSRLSNQAYGDPSKWRLIWKANQNTLRSDDPNRIYPGEVLQIPANPVEEQAKKATGLSAEEYLSSLEGQPDNLTLIIEGKTLIVESARVVRTMDTVADGCTVVVTWNPDDKEAAKVLVPYSYKEALVYLGPWLVIKGLVYSHEPEEGEDGSTMTLEIFSKTADLADSSMKPPYEQKKVTLKRRAEELIEPLGFTLVYEADEGEEFDRVTAQPEDTILSHLSDLASQRSVLISSNTLGEVVFYQANIGESVGAIEVEAPLTQSIKAKFDGRQRFNSYRVIGPTPKRKKGNAIEAVAKDNDIPRSRFKTIVANDATEGNIQSVADWQRSKQLAEALKFAFPVNKWYAPDGSLWRENTIVTVKSKTVFTPDGFDYLIRQVEYIFSEEGATAVLDLVPPQVYTEEPVEVPWA